MNTKLSNCNVKPNLIHIPTHISCSLGMRALFFVASFAPQVGVVNESYHGTMSTLCSISRHTCKLEPPWNYVRALYHLRAALPAQNNTALSAPTALLLLLSEACSVAAVHEHVHVHVHVHVRTYVRTYVSTYVHTYTHTCVR